jgi:NADH-quinone oxidoreductase subunit J
MTLPLVMFYIFAFVITASAVMVIASRNPVHSVLYLILAFVNSAGLFVLVGAEFLAMVLVVVYVGAVAVLFLFVVMMLEINYARLRQGIRNSLPVGILVGVVLLAELVMIGSTWAILPHAEPTVPLFPRGAATNAEALGLVLYTDFVYIFQVAGLILLVAIIGAITLTLRAREGVRRQDIGAQVHRDPRAAIELRKVKTGSGV